MIVLGISGFFHHDPAAALLVDGRLAAAAEEERFTREKHAPGALPVRAARFCLAHAAVDPEKVDALAYSWNLKAGLEGAAHYLKRTGFASRAMRTVLGLPRRARKIRKRVLQMCRELGIDPARTRVVSVPHHCAHAASAFLFSPFSKSAVLTADGRGELATTWAGTGDENGLHRLREWHLPDSMGMFYTSVTQYLGLPPNDGEYRTMGMAPWGDAAKADLYDLMYPRGAGFQVHAGEIGLARRQRKSRDRLLYGPLLPERFGPPRTGDALSEPYTHIAAAAQQILEETGVHAARSVLGEAIGKTGHLCLAGGVAMNVVWNRKLAIETGARRVYVPPAAGDAGCAAGAAALAASGLGDVIAPLDSSFLGPAFDRDDIRDLLRARAIPFSEPADPVEDCAALLARGEVVGWFQGRMEYGPRALGNRSILAHPGLEGTADRINAQVKFREPWRPFCPSLLAERAGEVLEEDFDAPFMSLAFTVKPAFRDRLSQTVHVNGTARAQTVDAKRVPGFHALLRAFEKRTGTPGVLNTSLNRKGDPMVCSPEDGLDMFFKSGLRHIYLEGLRVSKPPSSGGSERLLQSHAHPLRKGIP